MDYFSGWINRLIDSLSALPGIGAKTAQRLAFYIINMPQEQAQALAQSIIDARANVRYCRECFTLTDDELCPICKNPNRDHRQIMIVENTRDLAAYEKTGKYNGVYHVLHGAISPMLGIGPADIKIKELIKRLESDVDEVIIATNARNHSDVYCKACEAHGHQGYADSKRRAGGRRSGEYRRGDAAESP